MNAAVLELLPELLELVLLGASALGLSVAGAYIEQFAFQTVQSGEVTLGAWATVVGLVVLFFAYLVTTDKLPQKVDTVRTALAESA
ncbi:MAG: hypothetical protein ABEJ06_04540 [Haloarculaceae archaeon]